MKIEKFSISRDPVWYHAWPDVALAPDGTLQIPEAKQEPEPEPEPNEEPLYTVDEVAKKEETGSAAHVDAIIEDILRAATEQNRE